MPELGRYEKLPRPESIETFLNYLSGNKLIETIEREGDQILVINRKRKSVIKLFMTNVYIIGIADVYEILSLNSDINAIVTMSAWNGYTQEAKLTCKQIKVGLFLFKEFLGAVYYDGTEFLDYITPEERERIRSKK